MFAKIYRSVERNQKKERSGIMKLSEKVLKWVEREYGVMTADNVAKDIIEKTIEEIRKRVEQLLKEIEEFSFKLKIKVNKKKNINKDYVIGFSDGLLYSKKFIKKAFSEVVEE